MSKRYPGGFIFRSNPTIVGPVDGEGGSAPGVWTLEQASYYTKLGIWPKRVIPRALYSWGYNISGQLGQNDRVDRSSPVQIGALTNWSNLGAGSSTAAFFLAITTNKSIWAWGSNNSGELGLNDQVYRSSPVQVGALTNWAKTARGQKHSLAIKTDSTLWSWGDNGNGQLGQNNRVNLSSPVQIGALTNWSVISCGTEFSAATKTDGTLWSWGRNQNGQLGQNNRVDRSSPVQVGALTTWNTVACGDKFAIAIKTDGTMWAWGANDSAQLGLGLGAYRSSPVQVGSLTTWSTGYCGSSTGYALKTDGTLWSWGSNSLGQLGQNINYNSIGGSPGQVGSDSWSKISSGSAFVAAIRTNGTLWAWGQNNYGQLGQNNTTNRSSPVQIGALNTWDTIATGNTSCIAVIKT